MSTLLSYAPALGHTMQGHPENKARLVGMVERLEELGVLGGVTAVSPQPATKEQLQRVHDPRLLEHIERVSRRGGGLLDRGDTYATAESYELARLAAGACCQMVDEIMVGKVQKGFALVRPPGHHAEFSQVSGFCLINNVAVAARQARVVHGAKRVMIIDFDVHHGNGTQDIFYEDDTILFASLHLFAPFFYPGVGSLQEVGLQKGLGYTLNVPLPPYVGDVGYLLFFQELIIPAAHQFQPDMIMVSAGFDAHWQDPLAMAGLSLTGYGHIAQMLVGLADELCGGRIMFVLEGGYKLDVLTLGIANVFQALNGRDHIFDPFGPMPQTEENVTDLLESLKRRHLRN
ncbi:MAG: histone deacetylase [Ardenticatenaceae bacterium]|nr:histone deacetylase [Ardenticatenaceae bacterium]